jgi:putative nucleotidyltransferase with HDIG domain/PAS domain S-box-containing protein
MDNTNTRQALRYGQDLAAIYQVEKAEREELEIAYQTLNAVFASTPDALLVLDDALIIQQANRAFGRLIEMEPESVVGHLLVDVFPVDDLVAAMHEMANRQGEENGAATPSQIELTVTQPVKRFLLAHVARLRAGRTQGWIVVLHEQSRQKRLENQKIEFINIAAHELRTPLALILGFSQMLAANLGEALSAEDAHSLEAIKIGGHRLQAIIDELMEFAQVQQGEVTPDGVVEFDLAELINSVAADLQQLANSKQVSLLLNLPPAAVHLRTDAKLLRTAVYQLLLNGINFNKCGGSVRVSIAPLQDNVYIQVQDTGVGIPQTELDAIFGPFVQVEEHNTRKVGGLGLGLSMALRAVRQLGGSLSVESTLDEGSRFNLQLPLNLAETSSELSELRTRLEATYRQSLAYARQIHDLNAQLQHYFMATLAAMNEAIEARDVYTRGHSDRVAALALRLARRLGYSERALRTLEMAGRLHDIGKLGTPDRLLTKGGNLTTAEYEQVKQHVTLGWKILEPLDFLHEILPVAFSHHERWDGLGYPQGLAGEAIPLGGRILAVADAYLAMTSPRSFREAIPHQEAVTIIREGAGSQWDPEVVDAFLELLEP